MTDIQDQYIKHESTHLGMSSNRNYAMPFSPFEGIKQEDYFGQEQKPMPKKINQPSEAELCEAVVLLKRMMPTRSLQRAITMLYQTLIRKQSPDQIFPINQSPPQQLKPSISQSYQQGSNEVIRQYMKDDLLKTKFSNDQEEKKYKQRRLVAKSFVAKGYGHSYAEEEFARAKFTTFLNKQGYKSLISSVITQAFRKLQSFLIEDCHKKIIPLTKDSMKKVLTPLLSSTHFGEQIVVFKKYLRLLFGLSSVTISQAESVRFYLQVMKIIYNKTVTLQEIESFGNSEELSDHESQVNDVKHSIEEMAPKKSIVRKFEWTEQMDEQLIDAYISCKSLAKVSDLIIQEYPSISGIDNVRSIFFKLLQNALKRVLNECAQENDNSFKMNKLSGADMAFITRSKDGLKVRISLFQYWKEKEVDRNKLYLIAKNIRELVAQREFDKISQSSSLKGYNLDSSEVADEFAEIEVKTEDNGIQII